MAQFNPYQQYDNVTFGTANPATLIVSTYSAAIRSLKEVVRSLEEGDFQSRVKNMDLAFELISELRKSLNPEQGGEIALGLDQLYQYFSRELITANAYGDPERVKPVIKLMTELRDAWNEVKRKEENAASSNRRTGVSAQI